MADNTATNPITGDRITTKRSTTYADNYKGIDWSVKLVTDEPLCSLCGEFECKCESK